MKQLKEREDRLEEMSKVVSAPLARYAGDKDLEEHLKDQELKEDPMLEYVRKKKLKKHVKQGRCELTVCLLNWVSV